MDVLTKEQLKQIADIISDHMGVLLKVTTGEGEADSNLLHKLGLPLDATSMIQDAFVLGKIVQMLQENDISKMTFEELKEKAKQYRLSAVERNSLEFAKRHAANYVTALGQRISRDINGTIDRITYDANLAAVERNIIRDKVAQAILKQQTKGRLVSELGHALGDWKRDWQRVAHTELWNAKLQGEVITILQGESIYSDSRGDTLVFRRPSPDACQHCKRLYLQPDGVTPKVFKLKDLIANGTNVGRKAAEWQPVTGTTHPNCTCPIAVLPPGFGFDEEGNLVYLGLKEKGEE